MKTSSSSAVLDDDLLGIEFRHVDAHLFHHLFHLPGVHTASAKHTRRDGPRRQKGWRSAAVVAFVAGQARDRTKPAHTHGSRIVLGSPVHLRRVTAVDLRHGDPPGRRRRCGGLRARPTQGTDPDALSTITVYVLAPALVVHSLTTSSLAGDTILSVVLAVVLFTAAMVLLAEGVGRLTGHSEPLLGAFVLVSIFPNTGNYGIPLADFAFGATGRSTAVLVTALQGVLLYTVGIYIAARGSGGSPLADMRRVFGVPLIYAVVVALALRWVGASPPTESTVMQTLELLGKRRFQ